MNLEKVFESIKEKMITDFQGITSAIEHKISKGQERETLIVNEYLKKYVPGNIGIARGEIVSIDDQVSPETDIILYEKNSTPYLINKEGYQVFPIECVYGVIEVKSKIDKSEIEDSFKKINKIKKMPKLAIESQKGPILKSFKIYDREWSYFPTFGMVIGYDSIDLKLLKNYLDNLNSNMPLEHRIDSVWVLKKGMIINYNFEKGIIEMYPRSTTVLRAVKSNNPLLLLTIHLHNLLLSGWVPPFQIIKYLENANFGTFYD